MSLLLAMFSGIFACMALGVVIQSFVGHEPNTPVIMLGCFFGGIAGLMWRLSTLPETEKGEKS